VFDETEETVFLELHTLACIGIVQIMAAFNVQ